MYEMRRKKQQMSYDEAASILNSAKTGVLAVCGGDEPYAVPLNYVYYNEKLYFHCALVGRKLDEISRNGKVSFCVVAEDDVVPERFTTRYRSVIANGFASVLPRDDEFYAAIRAIAAKYSPNVSDELRENEIEKYADKMNIIAVEITQITGKCGLELC